MTIDIYDAPDLLDVKSKFVMSKPRLEEYIKDICNRPIDKEKVKKAYKENEHARVYAKQMTRSGFQKYINSIS